MRDVARFGDVVGLRKALLRIAENVVIVLLDVVGPVLVNEVALRLHRLLGIEVRGQRLVFDVDQLERALGNLFADGRDAGDVIANVTDFSDGQCRLVVPDRKNAVRVRRVLTSDDRNDTFQRLRARCVDAYDARVRIGRMQNLADQHPRHAEVVSVLTCAGRLAGGVNHRDRFSDNRKVTH